MMKYFLLCLILATTTAGVLAAGKRPWQKRIGRNVKVHHKSTYRAIDPGIWPKEPEAPGPVVLPRLERALSRLCGPMPANRLQRYTALINQEASRFEVDPFLLGALMYDASGCRPRTPKTEKRFGLTRIDVKAHRPHVRQGKYRYFLRENGIWAPHEFALDRFPFNGWTARKDEQNLYFAAALLRMYTRQCPDLDAAFGGARHRHPVSHWFYGDVVRLAEPESRVLTVRRRLIDYYLEAVPRQAGEFRGGPIFSPLDGAPRIIIDYFGNARDHNPGLAHRGIDIDGVDGEPVRAIAPGKVIFSGMDLPGSSESAQLPPTEATHIPRQQMGRGGLYVRISHENGYHSLYMHLRSTSVVKGATVKPGDQVGTVGRSGTVASGPHLHLELRSAVDPVDPAVPLQSVLVNPFAHQRRREIAQNAH